MNFYNDNDPRICSWLRELIDAGEIPPGEVCGQDINKLRSSDLAGYGQHHFFCGVGGWPKALALAGWPADRPIWSASLPCQPWSNAGEQKGADDGRNLWPTFYRLVKEFRPEHIVGEQVEAAVGLGWLDGISTDLEAAGYTVGAVVLPACSVGAPHRRYRIFWVAHRLDSRSERAGEGMPGERRQECGLADSGNVSLSDSEGSGPSHRRGRDLQPVTAEGCNGGLPNPNERRLGARDKQQVRFIEPGGELGDAARERFGETGINRCGKPAQRAGGDESASCELDQPKQPGLEGHSGNEFNGDQPGRLRTETGRPTVSTSDDAPWRDFAIVHFTDGKVRRIEPGTFPVAPRLPKGMVPCCDPSLSEIQNTSEARSWRLHGYGNSIVPHLAAEFVKAFLDTFVTTNPVVS